MSGFQHLSVDGFRRLCGVECELRDLIVMIGANGSGKTSVLDVFSLLAASAQGRLNDKLSELGGIAAILTDGRAKQLSLSLSSGASQYNLSIAPRGVGYTIGPEILRENGHIYLDLSDSFQTSQRPPRP